MKNLIIDLDNTLTIDDKNLSYEEKKPNLALVEKLKEYQKMGFKIIIFTSRNMKTYEGNIDKIRANTLPVILKWLEKHKIPYDEVRIGKAWCGEQGFYVDDKAVRPSEFVNLNYEEIFKLLESQNAEALQDALQNKENSQNSLNLQNALQDEKLSQISSQEQGGGIAKMRIYQRICNKVYQNQVKLKFAAKLKHLAKLAQSRGSNDFNHFSQVFKRRFYPRIWTNRPCFFATWKQKALRVSSSPF